MKNTTYLMDFYTSFAIILSWSYNSSQKYNDHVEKKNLLSV